MKLTEHLQRYEELLQDFSTADERHPGEVGTALHELVSVTRHAVDQANCQHVPKELPPFSCARVRLARTVCAKCGITLNSEDV